jgi:hypothetical protein
MLLMNPNSECVMSVQKRLEDLGKGERLHVLYNNKTGAAHRIGMTPPEPLEVRGEGQPQFNLGERNAGCNVRVFTDRMEDGDEVYTVVTLHGWTVPVPFILVREPTPTP